LITSVKLPASVTRIGDRAFKDSGLVSIVFPPELTYMGGQAFAWTRLKTVDIPDSTYIGGSAFEGCYDLVSVTIRSARGSVKSAAFKDCFRLSEVVLPNNLSWIGTRAFSGCLALKELTLPGSVSLVDSEAFLNSGLRKVKMLGGSLIGTYAFAGCVELSEFEFPSHLSWVGDHAFEGCPLKSIEFRSFSLIIGSSAFNTYSGPDPRKNPLKRIVFHGEPPSVSKDSFGPSQNPDAVVYRAYGQSGFGKRWHGFKTDVIKRELRVEAVGGKVLREYSTYTFKPTKVGSAGRVAKFRIWNSGTYRFELNEVRVFTEGRKSFYAAKVPGKMLEPGEGILLKVRFKPRMAGDIYGEMEVAYDIGMKTARTIRLRGMGRK
ncbi:MAG: leucine-rich repeat domain-containing protein, partial [Verrucomicrobiaceae bacterium]